MWTFFGTDTVTGKEVDFAFESPGLRRVTLTVTNSVGLPAATEAVIDVFESSPHFLRGDTNADGKVDIADPIASLDFQFVGTFDPPCRDALDFDDNGVIDVSDPIANLTHQFLGGPAPASPGKDACGVDPTADDLTCESFAACPAGG